MRDLLEVKIFLKFAVPMVVFFAVSRPIAIAQHGGAEDGYYALDYHGDTWTGTLSAVDHDHDRVAITLTYEHKGKVQVLPACLSIRLRSRINMASQPEGIYR